MKRIPNTVARKLSSESHLSYLSSRLKRTLTILLHYRGKNVTSLNLSILAEIFDRLWNIEDK